MPPVFHAPASAFSGRLVWLFVLLISSFVIPTASAHPSDISYLRVKVERESLELRFTFNLLTLGRFAEGLDADLNHEVTQREIEATVPKLRAYLTEKIRIEINGETAQLGELAAPELLWPEENGSRTVAERDYSVRHVDLTFRQAVKPLLADVWLDIAIWEETGPLSSIEARYEQAELITQVPFTQSEPDYLYDTGFAVEDIFQTPEEPRARVWAGAVTMLVIAAWMLYKRWRR